MLNVGQLNEGFVLDHIEAGKSMMIYNNLGLGELDCQVAIIKNARSSKMGRKDIIKIEGGLDRKLAERTEHSVPVRSCRGSLWWKRQKYRCICKRKYEGTSTWICSTYGSD